MAIGQLPTRFQMQGARTAIASGLVHISRQVTALEEAIHSEPGLAFDLAKVLVESVCKTLLTDLGISFAVDEDLPKLYRLVTSNIPLLPTAASAEVSARESVKRALGGMSAALGAICELRNAYGFASHGSDVERVTLESTEALLAAQSADAIIGFLYANHVRLRKEPTPPAPTYQDLSTFNRYIDDQNEIVRVFDLEYQPSEVLFYVDREAYNDQLAGFAAVVVENMQSGVIEDDNEGGFKYE